MAVGQAMAQGLSGAFAPPASPGSGAPAASAAPAAPEAAADSIEERLAKLKGLLDKGLISQADYDSAKGELLKKLIG
jgi:membrane protease subunit (stomatin/prohibitin family)